LTASETVASYFKTSVELLNLIETALLKVSAYSRVYWIRFIVRQLKDDSVEEINEHHVGAWTEMITNSDPPVPNTPVSPYLDKHALGKHSIALKNKKIKETVKYQLKRPNFNAENVAEVVEKWKSEGNWPNLE
jgi:hypothetical protein